MTNKIFPHFGRPPREPCALSDAERLEHIVVLATRTLSEFTMPTRLRRTKSSKREIVTENLKAILHYASD